MEIEDYYWLVSDEGRSWLDRVRVDDRPAHQVASSLRKDHSISRTHLLLDQKELRNRALLKFPLAKEMFFTRRGLEQSTDFWVASHKARRFPGECQVADLCCGVGGDLLALAKRGPVVGVDLDPVLSLFALENAKAAGVSSQVSTKTQAVEELLGSLDVWHIDPDRRPDGKRVSRIETSLPSAAWMNQLLTQHPTGAIKLAPGDPGAGMTTDQVEWEFISRDGEVRQQVVYFGALTQRPMERVCTVLSRAGRLLAEFSALTVDGAAPPQIAPRIGRYLYEPDASVTVAGLETNLGMKYELAFTSFPRGYLTGDVEILDPVMQRFEVIEAMPFDRRKLKSALQTRGIGRLEVKSREKSVEANQLQKDMATRGGNVATLLVTRFDGKIWAVLANRPAA
jgi:hypothetical protein